MAGDGINDSIALGKSNIAIAMGNGIDVAINISDIIILDSSVNGILEAFKIGRKTLSLSKKIF